MRFSMGLAALVAGKAEAEPLVIHSKSLGADRKVEVQVPTDYRAGEQYPVLYVLDGESLFAPAAALARWLEYVTRTPGLIVVGIPNTQRTRDFTTRWTAPGDAPDSLRWMIPAAGGADAFRGFLTKELIPEIDRRYLTAPFRILAGHSLGGLFALDTIAKEPSSFASVIAISPPAAWNNDEVIRGLRSETFAGSAARLFLAAAGNDPADTLPAFHRLVETLNGVVPAARWRNQILPDEDHGTVAIPALQAGLQFSFPSWRVPGYLSEGGLVGIREHYSRISRLYGYRVRVQERELSRLAYQWLRAKRVDEAVGLFGAISEDHPSSANAHDDLGAALAQAGRPSDARREIEKAVEIAQKAGDANAEVYRKHLAAIAN
ncbi:MAG: alpha/beta hydrolase-fold protein [Acidobacteriota bacterium]|nr:alpha/beta hydrolase-fold protein [Acidobacteriota bacterium]